MSERLANSAEHPILELTDENVAAMLRRVVRLTSALAVATALVLWIASGWQTAALFVVGATISIGSIYEWARLIRVVMARLDQMDGKADSEPVDARKAGLGPMVVIFLFLMRLTIAGVAIYVSLKCFHGSPIALLCGLGLALAGLVWEAMRVLRG